LGEIESALRQHPALADACVQIHDAPPRGPELVAYAVPASAEALPGDLRDALRERLPDYALPSRIVQLAALPRLSNGKLDRSRLRPELGSAATPTPVAGAAADPSRSPVEARIATIWRDVLHTDAVRVDENFFDAGGNSLLLTQLVVRLNAEFEASITRMDMFRYPTIRAMAQGLFKQSAKDKPEFKSSVSVERQRKLDLLQRRGRL